jgi:acetyl esterase/lipase
MLALAAAAGVFAGTAGAADETVRLWPGDAPGTEDWKVRERTFKIPTKESGVLTLVTDVTVPTLTVVRPDPAQANGTAVVVCPGGGFKFLSWENEGMEVARWLAQRGVTAFVLKYRVRMADDVGAAGKDAPKTFEAALAAGGPKIRIAHADAVQAIRHLRANAEKYGISRDRVGMMGFSAGAMTTMSVVLKADAEDRPDFAAPVYGAMEDAPVPKDAPPLFIVHTQADAMVPAAQATKIFHAWTAAKRPAELHLYQEGAHGFGMHKVGSPVDGWTGAFENWLRSAHLLERRTTPKAADETDVVGAWRLKYEPGDGQTHEPVLTVTKDGSALKAEFIDGDQKGVVKEVLYKDGQLRARVETKYNGETATTTYAGKIEGDALKGEATWAYQGLSGSFSFEGKRGADNSRPPASSGGAAAGKPSPAQGAIPRPRPITDPRVAHEALPDLRFHVYYPRDIMERETPVPVISWGNGGCKTFDWMSTTLLERWAAAGYVVVTYNDPAAKPASVGVEAQTAAQVRMLDWAEKANAEGGRFAGKLDTQRMVVGGNSCGGVTAFNAAWADKRPKAILIVSGSTQFPGVKDEVRKASAGRVELPTLYIVGGPEDLARAPVRLEYESLRPGLPAVLIERSSGDHVAVSNDPDIQLDEAAMAINWFRAILHGDKDAAGELATKGCAACDPKVWSVRSRNLPK